VYRHIHPFIYIICFKAIKNMKKYSCIRIAFTVLVALIGSLSLQAQTTPEELSKIILEKDSLFWKGYNNCDTSLTGQLFYNDVEFYHDKGGITNGLSALQASLKNNLCSNPDWRLRREAVPGTVKCYPLYNNGTIYGAILLGEHYFYITEKGKPEFRDGHASFTHLWLKENGQWKMKRVLSYDHHAAAKTNERKAISLPAASLKQYTGMYEGPQTDSLFIREENGALIMVSGSKKTPLYAEKAGLFFMKDRDLTFEFIRDGKAAVTGMRVRENGAVAEELKRVK
jgi:hypothetical protein